EATVDLVAFQARPDRLEITTGTTVTWINKEPIDYPVKSGRHEIKADDGSFASPSMAPGTRWSHRFNLPGAFTYHCADHTELAGRIVVTGPPIVEKLEEEVGITEDKPDDPTTWGFRPADLIITTGMTVVWRNIGTNVHTVSADDKRFDSGNITPGSTWKYRFDEPGVFTYHCTPHPWMKASIRVVVPGGAPPPPPPLPASSDSDPSGPTQRAREPAVRTGTGPVRHEVDIVEVNPAKPNTWVFDPPTLDLMAGDTIVWRNTGSMQHSVTADDGSFDSGLINPGRTWSKTFPASLSVGYHCTPHPWMKGGVRVAEPGKAAPALRLSAATSANTAAGAAPPLVQRSGSGPVTVPVNIVEPTLSDAMSWGFAPKVVDVKAGDTVVWKNMGTIEHSVTADAGAFDAGLIKPGATFERKFDTPGVYAYHCTPHPWMKGIVRVASAEGGAVPAIPAGLDTAGSGGGSGQAASPAESALSLPGHIIGKINGHGGNATVKLGWALLLCALAVGFTILLSWVWQYPVPAAARIQTARDLIR
ncbi:MAG TPA: plastocyanin/azurin family copper-binding protein, partial [Acidimicrobiia bacterium]|nr:plastocyanin/azurin family copper-binding protein [Acidimicrobiia bacterium]